MYHMISEPQTVADTRQACPSRRFEKHLQLLLKEGYTPVSIDRIAAYYAEKSSLPNKAVLITFDDGFEDNYLNAFHILQRYNVPAIIYLATEFIGQTNKWMPVPTYSQRKMLSWTQIQEMSSHGIQFGSHTVSHPKLTELDDDCVSKELVQSKQTIEDRLGLECRHFAYPYGLLTEKTRDWVQQAGFKTACSTQSGFNNAKCDPLILHRIDVYGNDSLWKFQQKVTFGMNNANLLYPLKYYYNRYIGKI
jgi:peptidoglycan/xylan/chitin deacetylase (PgdA/CDA1 family)